MMKRYLPLLLITGVAAIAIALDLHTYLSLDTLKNHRDQLDAWVAQYPYLSPLVFTLIYAAAVALSFPGAVFLTIAGGYLFGTFFGGILVTLAATLGATIIFQIAKSSLGNLLSEKAGAYTAKMEKGFKEDAFSYLMVLRLVPLFPFWLINIVPALLNVRLPTYVSATLLGIIPGCFVYASVGNGLSALLDAGQDPDLSIIFKPAIFGPILGLSVLALIPVVYKRLRPKDDENTGTPTA